jgi:hypothetical protein
VSHFDTENESDIRSVILYSQDQNVRNDEFFIIDSQYEVACKVLSFVNIDSVRLYVYMCLYVLGIDSAA